MTWFLKKKKKKTLEKHFISQDMLVSCYKKNDSGMNFVSHQNSCFASLSELASRCSFDQQPKSVRATLLQLYYHKMHILSFYVLYACPEKISKCNILHYFGEVIVM